MHLSEIAQHFAWVYGLPVIVIGAVLGLVFADKVAKVALAILGVIIMVTTWKRRPLTHIDREGLE